MQNPPSPQSKTRHRGPRPLPLHMAMQTLMWMSSLAALPSLKNDSINWSPRLAKKAASLQKSLASVDTDIFKAAVEEQSRQRLAAFADGIQVYRTMPSQSRPVAPPAIWTSGNTRLLDYGVTSKKAANGPPILFVPSLINRAYILDLTETRSLMRFLATQGFRPLLVDWGDTGPDEQGYTLDDYIAGRLVGALTAAANLNDRPVTVAGYCMGGLLGLALAQLCPDKVSSLALLATPWDFSAMDIGKTRMLRAMAPGLESMLDVTGVMPVDVLQAMFASLDPQLTPRKFQAFSALDQQSDPARDFVALEDWVNDGVPLAGAVARECLSGWYVDNITGRGQWRIDGQRIRPEKISVPTLVVAPKRDHIVPPATVVPLGRQIPNAPKKALLPAVEVAADPFKATLRVNSPFLCGATLFGLPPFPPGSITKIGLLFRLDKFVGANNRRTGHDRGRYRRCRTHRSGFIQRGAQFPSRPRIGPRRHRRSPEPRQS